MERAKVWLARIRAWIGGFTSRVGKRLDDHADKRTGEWGASMEYKRRYTNPDDAKRHRSPPPDKT